MALRAGYKGIKKYVADMLNKMNPGDTFATDAEIATKADISALGTQEGATASRLYHPGEHFYKDGKFCTVIGGAGVASGTTWTLNTNYVEGTVADNLKVITAYVTTNNENVTIDSVKKVVLRQGNVCSFFVRFTLTDAIVSGLLTGLFTVPYIPFDNQCLMRYEIRNRNQPFNIVSNCFIATTGIITVNDNISEGTYDICGTFICR